MGSGCLYMAEAITSKGEKVILSFGTKNKQEDEDKPFEIGRDISEACPNGTWHLLDSRHSFPFWTLEGDTGTAAAIDEDGEVWILCA